MTLMALGKTLKSLGEKGLDPNNEDRHVVLSIYMTIFLNLIKDRVAVDEEADDGDELPRDMGPHLQFGSFSPFSSGSDNLNRL